MLRRLTGLAPLLGLAAYLSLAGPVSAQEGNYLSRSDIAEARESMAVSIAQAAEAFEFHPEMGNPDDRAIIMQQVAGTVLLILEAWRADLATDPEGTTFIAKGKAVSECTRLAARADRQDQAAMLRLVVAFFRLDTANEIDPGLCGTNP